MLFSNSLLQLCFKYTIFTEITLALVCVFKSIFGKLMCVPEYSKYYYKSLCTILCGRVSLQCIMPLRKIPKWVFIAVSYCLLFCKLFQSFLFFHCYCNVFFQCSKFIWLLPKNLFVSFKYSRHQVLMWIHIKKLLLLLKYVAQFSQKKNSKIKWEDYWGSLWMRIAILTGYFFDTPVLIFTLIFHFRGLFMGLWSRWSIK